MFDFSLNIESSSSAYYNELGELKFNPPVYEQRYCITARILEHDLFIGNIKKVIDFGCAELKLLEQLKRIPQIENIMEVDIDEETLLVYSQRAKPLASDYLNRRVNLLRIDICRGSIDSSAEIFRDADAVIGLEIIEHLYPDVLNNVPYNIFGYIRPKLVIFSTPNSEYNFFFNLTLPNGFRHDDHKFEWTRSQFQDWCFNICMRFPNYQVSFLGVGESPPAMEDVGYVSQIAVFIRNDVRQLPLIDYLDSEPEMLNEADDARILGSTEFPVLNDERTFEERLLDDIKYHLFRYTQMKSRYSEEFDRYEVPVQTLYELLYPSVLSVNELKDILQANHYVVDVDDVILVDNTYSGNSSSSSSALSKNNSDVDIEILLQKDMEEVWD